MLVRAVCEFGVMLRKSRRCVDPYATCVFLRLGVVLGTCSAPATAVVDMRWRRNEWDVWCAVVRGCARLCVGAREVCVPCVLLVADPVSFPSQISERGVQARGEFVCAECSRRTAIVVIECEVSACIHYTAS